MASQSSTKINKPRPPKTELSPYQRTAIIQAHKLGKSPTILAREFKCSRSTIYDTFNRFKQHQTTESLPRSGRPKALSLRAERLVNRLARRNPEWSYQVPGSQVSSSEADGPSKSTIRRLLGKYGAGGKRNVSLNQQNDVRKK